MTERPQMADMSARQEQFMRALDQRQTLAGLIFAAMSAPRSLAAPARSLPLTIIGGFLGAGKTTLLNRLLADPQGRRLVVLVNDFGKINIDAELIAEQTGDTITLTNGCACCAVSSDLSKSLVDIAQRAERPDAILLETSGVSEPGSIAQIALANQAIRLDGIITVVDAETLEARAGDPGTCDLFKAQASSADILLLSKLDLMTAAQQCEVQRELSHRFPGKPVLTASEGQVPPDIALGIGSKRGIADFDASAPVAGHGFETFSVEIDQALDGPAVRRFFSDLPDSLLRAKGFLYIAQTPERPFLFQRVGKRWSIEDGTIWGSAAPRTRLVFIGLAGTLDKAELHAGLTACVAAEISGEK